jgi:hypothetical protein
MLEDIFCLTNDNELHRFIVYEDKTAVVKKYAEVSPKNKATHALITGCKVSDDSFVGVGYNNESIEIHGIIAWYDKRTDLKNLLMNPLESEHSLVVTNTGKIWEIIRGVSCYAIKDMGTIPSRVQQWIPKPTDFGQAFECDEHVIIHINSKELSRINGIASRFERRNKLAAFI